MVLFFGFNRFIDPGSYELKFAGNTYISITGLSIPVGDGYEIRYEFVHYAGSDGGDEGLWGDTTDIGVTSADNGMWLTDDSNDMRRVHGTSGQYLLDINYTRSTDTGDRADDTWIYVKEDTAAAGKVFVTAGTDDTYAGWSDENDFTGKTGTITELTIGHCGTRASGLIGKLRNFEIYNSSDALIHSWAINDNSTTITDSVGGADGTLTLGSGSWVPFGAAPPPAGEAHRVYSGSTSNPVFSGSTSNPVYSGSSG